MNEYMTMKKKIGEYKPNKEIYAMVKKGTVTEIITLNSLFWFGHVQRREENRIPKKYYI